MLTIHNRCTHPPYDLLFALIRSQSRILLHMGVSNGSINRHTKLVPRSENNLSLHHDIGFFGVSLFTPFSLFFW